MFYSYLSDLGPVPSPEALLTSAANNFHLQVTLAGLHNQP